MQMTIRSLTAWEYELVVRALRLLETEPSASKTIRAGAKSMLDQKMPENMLWKQS